MGQATISKGPSPIYKKGVRIPPVATSGVRRESEYETILQSCNIPLGYQGLLASGQGGEGSGKNAIEGGSVPAVSIPFLGPGDSRLANPKGPQWRHHFLIRGSHTGTPELGRVGTGEALMSGIKQI